jgi:hypothetical protein
MRVDDMAGSLHMAGKISLSDVTDFMKRGWTLDDVACNTWPAFRGGAQAHGPHSVQLHSSFNCPGNACCSL